MDVRVFNKMYITYLAVMGIVTATLSPMTERTEYHKMLTGISFVALAVSFALWIVTLKCVIEDNSCKIHVFNAVFYSSLIVPLYGSASILLSEKFAPYLAALISLICLIITLYNFKDILISCLKRVWEKFAPREDQQPPTTNDAPRSSTALCIIV